MLSLSVSIGFAHYPLMRVVKDIIAYPPLRVIQVNICNAFGVLTLTILLVPSALISSIRILFFTLASLNPDTTVDSGRFPINCFGTQFPLSYPF